jgi:hypothetical protein
MIAPILSLIPALDPDFLSAARQVREFRPLVAARGLPILCANAAAP